MCNRLNNSLTPQRSSAGRKFEISTSVNATVEELKQQISTQNDGTPVENQRLIYSGRVLKDGESLDFYKIKDGHTVHLVKSGNKPAATTSAAVASTTAEPSSASPALGAPTGAPSNIAAGSGAFNPLADLTGARYAGYAQLPSASMFGPDGGMSLPNPDDMERMMDNPMVQQQMNEMLSNPQMVEFLINQSPEMRAMGPQVRQMLQSEQFRNMLTNPQTMRQMREMQSAFGLPGNQQRVESFPAPGGAAAAESTATPSTDATQQQQQQQQQANPFAAMFPGGMRQNPFAMFAPPNASTGAQQPATGANPWASAAADPGLMQAMMASLGQSAPSAAQPADTRPPEERYETQLRQLNEMGFSDFERNVQALRRSGGNVQGAIESLLSGGF